MEFERLHYSTFRTLQIIVRRVVGTYFHKNNLFLCENEKTLLAMKPLILFVFMLAN